MPAIAKLPTREIIEDFAKEIRDKRIQTARPSKEVINFRTDIRDGVERDVWKVPIEILRFRKDNGRIASDVLDYEKNIGTLDEKDLESQALIAKFLEDKNREKTDALTRSIQHDGQREPAIITCDGFLINGNRRKMVMDRLHREHPGNEAFAYMKAVILPGPGEEGGPPTLLEIEKIENRYQLQSDGRSEYYNFDRALSIKRKIELGLSLREQLRDDPRYVNMKDSDFERIVKKYEKDFLRPLDCVDRYLKQFRREGQYRMISTGMTDPEGRWQAFVDYSNSYQRCFKNPQFIVEHGINEYEIGALDAAALSIIRLRTIPSMPKVHEIMRDLPRYCSTREGKKEILKISEAVENTLSTDDSVDPNGRPLDIDESEARWVAKNKQVIIHHLKRASQAHESQVERETPLGLLEAAYKKLTHDNMDLSSIALADHKQARELISKIKDITNALDRDLFEHEKRFKEFKNLKQQKK